MRRQSQMFLRFALFLLFCGALRAGAQSPDLGSLLGNLPWRAIGPAIMGGRINDFAVDPNNASVVYAATASGGLWKTTNHGTTWTPLFDSQSTSSVGDVTLAPSNPEVVWIGTGEANNRQSSSWGNGVYRSTDGGKTWTHLGLSETHHIGRIVVHPGNPDIAYVAAGGKLWAASEERGVYKTEDGGKTWRRVLFANPDTGATDLCMDPIQPNTVYAALYQRRRTAFGFNGGGTGSGLFKTTDGGATWSRLAGGLPSGVIGRIGIDLCQSKPNVLMALVEHKEGGVFRSEDGGATWTRTAGNQANNRPMYYSKIRIDPSNDKTVWTGGLALSVSNDGGRTFRSSFQGIHSDFHAIWIDPRNSSHILSGCDGGIQWSWDGGRTWDFVNTLPLAQFYEIHYDMRRPYWVYGGLQDNGSWGAPSRTLTTAGVTNDEWIRVGGGDGFYCRVDPSDWRVVYAESQNGFLQRVNVQTGERKLIRPRPPAGEPAYRFDWNSPIEISPHNPRRLLFGGNRLFISEDRGDNWRRTDDLTRKIDRDKRPIMGVVSGPDTLSRNDGQENYSHILTISESPKRKGLLWVGTDDGNLQVSRDDGKTWANVVKNVPGVPDETYISRVVASHHEEGRAYVAFDGHRSNDFKPYLFVTEDFGASWRPISSGIPEGSTLSVVREHHRQPNLLFAGTERGLFVSIDRGENWTRFPAPLPMVPVDDLHIHPRDNDLILGTHGRGVYILHDIAFLEGLAAGGAAKIRLFGPAPAVQYRTAFTKGNTGARWFQAPEPPAGATLQFYLSEKPTESLNVKVVIKASDGTTVREMPVFAPDKGLNKVVWDLRLQPMSSGGGGGGQGGGFGGGGGGTATRGPRVLPGNYRATLVVGADETTVPIEVVGDPRIAFSRAAERAYRRAMETLSSLYRASGRIRGALASVRGQLASTEAAEAYKSGSAGLKSAVDGLKKRVAELEALAGVSASTTNPGRTGGGNPPPQAPAPSPPSPVTRMLAILSGLDSWTEPPSKEVESDIASLARQIRRLAGEVNGLASAIAEANEHLNPAGIPPIGAPARIETGR